MRIIFIISVFWIALVASPRQLSAQNIDSLINNGGCKSVVDELEEKYETNTTNLFAYSKYLHCLFQLKEKRKAKRLIEDFSEQSKSRLIEWDKMAYVIAFENDWSLLQDPVFMRNHLNVSAASNRWRYLGLEEMAKVAMENSAAALQNPNLYRDALQQIYKKSEDMEKLMPIYIQQLMRNTEDKADREAELLSLLDDPENRKVAMEYLEREVKANPHVPRYQKLLIWIYEARDEWEAALDMLEKMDSDPRNKKEIYDMLIADALSLKKYDFVEKAYAQLEEASKSQKDKNQIVLERIHFYKNHDRDQWVKYVSDMGDQYDSLILDKKNLNSPYLLDYTDYYYEVAKDKIYAIDLLEYYLEKNAFHSAFRPQVELKLGDYFARDGNRWDAVVYYNRVENTNKNKSVSEEARFRNAKISYYYGDFDWTKKQLEILKTATQEPIANDALELWLRIIENTPSDSDFTAMQTLAKAEWHRELGHLDSASAKLNTISVITDPGNPIMDDVYLLQAQIAHSQGDYQNERKNLNKIIEKFPDGIISDDAYYHLALLNIQEGKTEEAKLILEHFLLKYENSALLIEVRQLLNTIRADKPT